MSIGRYKILPPLPGMCRECGGNHVEGMPHERYSLYYIMRFRRRNGRMPTWEDAMAHCKETVKEYWRDELRKQGVDPEEKA